MSLTYDLYWSFRSPYSYLITGRLLELERRYDISCRVRLVYPLAVRTPEFFSARDDLWFQYFLLDVNREAEFLGLPLRWPKPDPVVMDMATRSIPKEQPYIFRLTHMGVAAAEAGRGLQFIHEVAQIIWSGSVDNWHEGDYLAEAGLKAGLNAVKLFSAADHDGERLAQIVEANQDAQRGAGHYGVPLIVFNGEPFFGQDRFDQFKWRLNQHGLKRRGAV